MQHFGPAWQGTKHSLTPPKPISGSGPAPAAPHSQPQPAPPHGQRQARSNGTAPGGGLATVCPTQQRAQGSPWPCQSSPVPHDAAQEPAGPRAVQGRHPARQRVPADPQRHHLDVEQVCQLHEGLLVCSRVSHVSLISRQTNSVCYTQIQAHKGGSDLDLVSAPSKANPRVVSTRTA